MCVSTDEVRTVDVRTSREIEVLLVIAVDESVMFELELGAHNLLKTGQAGD